MKKPDITHGPWRIGMSKTGLAVFGASHEEGIEVVVAKGSGWNMDNAPSEKHKANLLAIAALPDLLEALEKAHAFTMSQPENRELQPLHCAVTAALIKAGYTF